MDDSLDTLIKVLLEPFLRLADPAHRIFWPALLVSFLIAGIYHLVQYHRAKKSGGEGPRLRALAARWVHPSARLDYTLMFANSLLRPVLALPWLLTAFGAAAGLAVILDGWAGIPEPSGWPPVLIVVAYTAVLFIAWDATRYLLHRWLHTFPVLWELHKVHHSAEVLTPFSLYRAHPIEAFLARIRSVVVTAVVTGIFFHFFRDQAVQAQLLGVNAVGLAFNALGGNLRHSHVRLGYGSLLERFLISPAQHQIHHAPDPGDCHSNYGTWLAVWDLLAGTLVLSRDSCPDRFGLLPDDLNHDPHSLVSSLIDPLGAATLRAVRRVPAPWRPPASPRSDAAPPPRE